MGPWIIFSLVFGFICLSLNGILTKNTNEYPCCLPDWIERCVPGIPERKVWVCSDCSMPNISDPAKNEHFADNCGLKESCDAHACNCSFGCKKKKIDNN